MGITPGFDGRFKIGHLVLLKTKFDSQDAGNFWAMTAPQGRKKNPLLLSIAQVLQTDVKICEDELTGKYLRRTYNITDIGGRFVTALWQHIDAI